MTKLEKAVLARKAANECLSSEEIQRVNALHKIAKSLDSNRELILKENQKDLTNAAESNLPSSLIDRLKLTNERIDGIIQSVINIANQPQVIGEITEETVRPDGLIIQKRRIPIGVIAMIFESRPNVVVDSSALAIKSGNAILLKGGKEAKHSNKVFCDLIREAIKDELSSELIQLVEDRNDVDLILKQVGDIDLVIPRGGERLIQYVYENSKIPVIAHYKGLCHTFIDESCKLEDAINIILNAKVQRPGVCNAMETLLVHSKLGDDFKKEIINKLIDNGVEVRGDERIQELDKRVVKATSEDWDTEYLDLILSIKEVSSIDEAIEHIREHGSHHSEAILTNNEAHIEKFINSVDASAVMVNASTRFNDGGELGLGAELGISTSKIHCYGPMGAKEMTSLKYLVKGNGHIRK